MRTSFWTRRAAVLAVLLASAGCNDVITGLSCNESTPCGDGATCERGVCVYLDPDSGAPATDAGKPGRDAGKPGLDAAVPGADAGAKPDTGSADTGGGPDAAADGGAADVDGGADAGAGDAGPSCQPNEEWVESGCVQVFEVAMTIPTRSHGKLVAVLTRKDPRTTSPVPTAVEARWVRKKTMVGASLALVRTVDQTTAKFEGSWALTESGVYEVQAAFELNGSYLSAPTSQKVLPVAGTYAPSYVQIDPELSEHCVFGQPAKISVAADVVNVGFDKAELEDPAGHKVALAKVGEAGCGEAHCLPCSDTVARCIVLQTDFFHAGDLGLEALRGSYNLSVDLKDDESGATHLQGPVQVSRWARKVFTPTGMAPHAPLAVLADGTLLAAVSDRPPEPLGVAGTRELVAITPVGAVVRGPKGTGSVRTLSVVEQGAVAHVAMVSVNGALTAEQATYDVWYVTYANGAFGNPAIVNVGNGKQTRGVGVAWRAADLSAGAPVLAFVASEGGSESAHAALWPAGGTQYSRGTMTFRIDPNPPVLTALDRFFVGALDGNVHELVAGSGSTVVDAGAPVGPGAPVAAMLKTTKLAALGIDMLAGKTFVFQEGAPVTSVPTILPVAFVATTEAMLISASSSLFTLSWGSSTPTHEASAGSTFQRHGLLVGASGAVYLVGESSIGPSASTTIVRQPKGQLLSLSPSWKLTGTGLGGAVLDCAHSAPASTQGMLGLLHVPMLDGRVVTLVVDDPGPDLTPGAWPMLGHDGRRTYSYDGPRGCVP